MEFSVTGCECCPFKDSADGEFNKYCNHPNRGIGVKERYIGDDNLFSVRDVEEPLKSNLIQGYKADGDFIKEINGKTFIIYELPLNLYENEPYLDYPNWCPMLIEPIIVKAKFQVLM